VRRAVLAGHSMGGRLVTELAATEPERAIAVILLDAIVGDPWDRMVNVFRLCPPLLAGIGITLAVDTLSTVPLFADPAQARKLGRLVLPTLVGHVRRPWRLVGPVVSILRSRGSGWMLDKIAQERIPLFAIHGDRDIAVPISTGRSAARRGRGELVVVHGGTHSWLLKDPESLPAIMLRLMRGRLGTAVLKAQLDAGVEPAEASVDDVEAIFYAPGSLVQRLTPDLNGFHDREDLHQRPRYRFSVRID
jgi:pimeloyl-ACP methyl ester carboxylesterase